MIKHYASIQILSFFMSMMALGQGIQGSKHDFSVGMWSSVMKTNEICQVCHTPHNAINEPAAPLWNHEITVATFAVYTSNSLDAVIGQPSGTSKLCLSCHDGTVALDSWGGATGTVFWPSMHADVMGTNLTDDHPISFVYDTALASLDSGLYDPSNTSSGGPGTISADLLEAGRLECVSCHDVHNATGLDKLLRINNASSGLCLTCHAK